MDLTVGLGQRPRSSARRVLLSLLAVAFVLWPYMFSIADTETTFTLSNRTHYYLHANIDNQSFVYIAPGGSVSIKVTAPTSVYARVQYSPGQSVKGSGERTVDIQETVTQSQGANTCFSDKEGNACNPNGPTATASPERWDVVSSDLTAE